MTTYTSDAYGRRTRALSSEEGTTTYTWDPLGHLTEIASADATSTYQYGVTGMREKVTVETTSGVTWTESVWSGGELVSERDSDGTLLTYVWGPDRTPLSMKVASSVHPSGTYYYHTDAQGSVVAMTDESGDVVARYRYDAFGAVTHVGGSDGWLADRNPLRYRSYYLDRETGLYYLPARYYEPESARFLSPDPAPPVAGDPLSLNAYAYCQGDPVNLVDPDGARHEAGSAGGGRAYYDEQRQAATAADYAAAAASTVYGVARWIARFRPAFSLGAMEAILTRMWSAYGPNGPARVSWAAASITSAWARKTPLWNHGQADLSRIVRKQYYEDVNVASNWVPLGPLFSGVTMGVIHNKREYWDGHVTTTDSHYYWGLGWGTPGRSVSRMEGLGRTDQGLYAEIGLGALAGGAVGWHIDTLSPYGQAGGTFPGANSSIFYVCAPN